MNNYQLFVTVVELGGFSAAAKKLHRTPSSISKKMAVLEQQLNVQLFDRTTRNLAVTEAGKMYFEHCVDIAKRIELAETELLGISGEPSGTLTITWPNVISSSSVIDLLAEFCRSYPDIKVNVSVDNNHSNLIDEHIDLAFRMVPSPDSSMIGIELLKLKPILCASQEYIRQHGQPNNIPDIAKAPLLILNHAGIVKNFWRNLPGLKDLDLNKQHRVNDINALKHMATKGFGATALFRHMIIEELKNGQLIDLFPDTSFPEQPVYLMFHKYNFMPKKVSVFVNFFKEHYLNEMTAQDAKSR